MIEKVLYTCQYCFTDYKDKQKALECEENHKSLDLCNFTGVYKSKASVPDGCSTKIKVKFRGVKDYVEYRR